MPAPTRDAVKSDPPRPSVVVNAILGGRDKAAHHNHLLLRQRRNGGSELRISLLEQRNGLRMALIGDNHLARIHVTAFSP